MSESTSDGGTAPPSRVAAAFPAPCGLMGTTEPAAAEQATIPWDAARLSSVLTAVVYEHFTEHSGSFTFNSHGRDESYELLEPADDDEVLTFERKADGARFSVGFWVTASPVREPAP